MLRPPSLVKVSSHFTTLSLQASGPKFQTCSNFTLLSGVDNSLISRYVVCAINMCYVPLCRISWQTSFFKYLMRKGTWSALHTVLFLRRQALSQNIQTAFTLFPKYGNINGSHFELPFPLFTHKFPGQDYS